MKGNPRGTAGTASQPTPTSKGAISLSWTDSWVLFMGLKENTILPPNYAPSSKKQKNHLPTQPHLLLSSGPLTHEMDLWDMLLVIVRVMAVMRHPFICLQWQTSMLVEGSCWTSAYIYCLVNELFSLEPGELQADTSCLCWSQKEGNKEASIMLRPN